MKDKRYNNESRKSTMDILMRQNARSTNNALTSQDAQDKVTINDNKN